MIMKTAFKININNKSTFELGQRTLINLLQRSLIHLHDFKAKYETTLFDQIYLKSEQLILNMIKNMDLHKME